MSDARQGVLLVTRNFPPLLGGMERLNRRMLEGLAVGCRVALVGPVGCTRFAPTGSQVMEVPASPVWHFLPAALLAALRLALRTRPTVVLAGSGLTAPVAWLAARLVGARMAVYLHGLDVIATSRLYQAFWLPFIRRADIVITNSRNTRDLAAARGVPAGKMHVVHPGTDLPTTDPFAAGGFRAAQGFGARPILLSVGRLTRRKGLVEFVSRALPGILARQPDALLVVIGADAVDALHTSAGSQRQRIIDTAREAGVLQALHLMPPCDDATLSAAYEAADVHIFPVLEMPGDVEGFGMVAIEAAAHGLPTVAFRLGGVPDAVVDGTSGSLVEPGDYSDFSAQVARWLALKDQVPVRMQCRSVAELFGWDRFAACIDALFWGGAHEANRAEATGPTGAVGR